MLKFGKVPLSIARTGAFMTEATQFRQYAREAMAWSHCFKDESQKRALIEVACTWAYAAVVSEKREAATRCSDRTLLR